MKTHLAGWMVAASALFASAPASADVNVLLAWYGQSCGSVPGNVTSHVKSRCDGRMTCDYGVDVTALGDSAPQCAKDFLVLYACRGSAAVRLAQLPAEAHGKMITVSCAAGAKTNAQR